MKTLNKDIPRVRCLMCGELKTMYEMNPVVLKFEGIWYDEICDNCYEEFYDEPLCK